MPRLALTKSDIHAVSMFVIAPQVSCSSGTMVRWSKERVRRKYCGVDKRFRRGCLGCREHLPDQSQRR